MIFRDKIIFQEGFDPDMSKIDFQIHLNEKLGIPIDAEYVLPYYPAYKPILFINQWVNIRL